MIADMPFLTFQTGVDDAVRNAGRLIQEGTHQELVASAGQYRRLWDIQGAMEEEIERDLEGAAQA